LLGEESGSAIGKMLDFAPNDVNANPMLSNILQRFSTLRSEKSLSILEQLIHKD